jgi:hypothetical protein
MEEIKMLEDKKPVPTAPPPNIKPKPPSMPPPPHLKKGLNLGAVKLPPKVKEETLIPKIDMIQNELHKLEKMIHMDEKENAKEHHKLEEEIHENINIMKPEYKGKMTKKEAKAEAKKYKIPLTYVEDGKRKNKPVYMLQQELKYEKKKEMKKEKKAMKAHKPEELTDAEIAHLRRELEIMKKNK